ncbi:MAG: D-aminoacyl-tRNA deacylase [Actinomycetota bacterium]|nr:D-aminoacyl-tRNA deacylase [Actinomycetota bacterium]
MRVLVQRVSEARVMVGGEVVGEIGRGLLLFVGVTHSDDERTADALATKVVNLRLFDDDKGALNRSALDLLASGDGVGVLVVSQFTLYGDPRKGRRPSFVAAAPPDIAAPLVARFASTIADLGLPVAEGRFGAEMAVALVNDGPVTLWLDSADLQRPRRTSHRGAPEGESHV